MRVLRIAIKTDTLTLNFTYTARLVYASLELQYGHRNMQNLATRIMGPSEHLAPQRAELQLAQTLLFLFFHTITFRRGMELLLKRVKAL